MRVLIVEDETSVREVFRDLVTALGHEAIPVESAERGLENLQHDQAEAVLLDVRLPGMTGLPFAPPDAGGPLEAVALVTRVDGDGVALWFMDLVPSETHRLASLVTRLLDA